MAGTYIKGETKIRPGVYSRYENTTVINPQGSNYGIGALVLQCSWGPLNTLIELGSASEASVKFGGADHVQAINEMFAGGCSKVKAVRVGTGGTASAITLKDDAGVNAVTITAKYVGARAFSVTIRNSLINSAKRECIIYDGTTEFEKVSFALGSTSAEGGEPAALAAAFAKSANFSAVKAADGSKILAAVTQTAMTAGTDPTTTTEDYSTALNILEAGKFNVLCVDSVDTAVHALVSAFIDRIFENGARSLACLSEAKSTDLTTRMTDAAAFNDDKICYVLNSAYDADGNLYDGYKLAARIGGMIASAASDTSLTHTVINGFASLAEPLTNSQIEKALGNGCLVLSVNSNDQIWIESGINTLVSPSGNQDNGWKKIRRTKTRFELMDRIDAKTEGLVGKINNDTNGKATFIAAAQTVIDDMIAENKLKAGSTVIEDSNNPSTSDSAWFVIAADDIDSTEKSYLTYQFRFSVN